MPARAQTSSWPQRAEGRGTTIGLVLSALSMPSSHLKLAMVPSRILMPLFTNGKTEWLNNLPKVTQSERRGAGIYKCLSLSDFRNHRIGLMSPFLPGLL